MNFFVTQNFDMPFAKKFLGCLLRPSIWSQLVPMAKPTHFKVKASLKRGDLEFRRDICGKFSWTSVKTLAMEPVGLLAKPAHFQGQMSQE
ncbi:hypothetical protein H5410_012940 [Solanum commersonii]|uniref:Uncharacterized protein n=1 Tax=Solanum commersonii TaxID=4109 RepID=A0A9J6AU26_SOLCO|nr:hypothetical protein H5410_012940 [Solanum commersonii]